MPFLISALQNEKKNTKNTKKKKKKKKYSALLRFFVFMSSKQ